MKVELMLADRSLVKWEGEDGEDAARRYVDCHQGAEVIAWRNADRYGLHVGIPTGA